jgi:hypothetical protein
LAHERLALKPHSRVNRNFLSRATAIETVKEMAM